LGRGFKDSILFLPGLGRKGYWAILLIVIKQVSNFVFWLAFGNFLAWTKYEHLQLLVKFFTVTADVSHAHKQKAHPRGTFLGNRSEKKVVKFDCF
jgi:hypothetical protein